MTRVGSDGSIILTVKIDPSELKTGMASIKNGVKGMSGTLTKLGGIIAAAFSVRAIISFSNETSKLASTTEASVQRLIDIYGEASHSVGDFIDNNARALGMAKAEAAQFSAVYGNLFSVWADQTTNAQLTQQYLNATAVVASKTGRTMEDVQERIRSGLLGNTEAVEDLGIFVNIKTIEITEAFKRVADGRSWEQLNAYEQSQVRSLAILEQATKKYGNEVAQTTAFTRAQYNAAFQDFKNTWGQVVNIILMPILKVATAVLDVLTKGMQVMAGLTGKTIDATDKQASSIGGAVDKQNELTDAVKGTAKEQKKMLAGFDDLQILNENNSSGTSDESAGNGMASGTGFKFENMGVGDGGQIQEISTALATLMGIIGLSLAALGLWLLFLGNIPWGVGLIIAGIAVFGVSAFALSGQADVSQNAANALSALMGIVGGALVAIGIILMMLGSYAWGIGFIIAGAASLGVGIATITKFGANDIEQTIMYIQGIAAGALLALGIMLLVFNGANPLSIGLIIAGASLLAITVAQIAVGEAEEKTANMIHAIVAIASAAILALGIILLFTPASWGLAVGLIVAGAVGLASEAALNWDLIVENMRGKIGEITAIVSGALLVLGILLLFVPGAQGLAFGLIIAGAAGLATVVAFNWDFVVDKVKEIWDKVKEFWNAHIAPIFTAQWWADLGKKALNGLIGIVEKGLNFLIGKINDFIGGISKITSAVGDLVGADWSLPKIKTLKIPRLARGAVIPPNKEFLAVLGDQKQGVNIEAPLETIVDAFNIVLNNRSSTSGSGNTEVILEIDGREFGRAVVEQGKKETRRIGTRLVIA